MNEEIPKMEDVLKHIKSLESKIEELEEEHSELIIDNHNLKKQLANHPRPNCANLRRGKTGTDTRKL